MITALLIGSGGREHALANKLATSPLLERLLVAPGNPGTATGHPRVSNVDIDSCDISDHEAVVSFCQTEGVDLVVVGPEVPLVKGLADVLSGVGIACFGPSAAAARLEGSKSFTREFARRHGIPGPETAVFADLDEALAWLDTIDFDIVVKADGLAAGKGVVIPEGRAETEQAIREMLVDGSMGQAGSTVLLEERMTGEELSLFGISSATQTDPLGGLTAQDHKRVGAGDTGPNTGGMGAFAPVPGFDEAFVADLVATFLDPVTRGMAAEGTPYVGVIYAGIMLTPAGPRLVEYNCRFGDPEAQVLMPLIDSDLLEVLWKAATDQSWSPVQIKTELSAATVVVAAEGYPADPIKGVAIPDVEVPTGVQLIHAGTRLGDEGLVSTGGRVLNIVAVGNDLSQALSASYGVVEQLTGDGLFARPDIGWRHVMTDSGSPDSASADSASPESGTASTYASAGVSLTAGAATTARIGASVKSTHDERVVSGLGSFGGVFDIAA